MSKKIMVTKSEGNKKERVHIIHASIFDVSKNHNNIYTLKKLIELERIMKGTGSISYDLELVEEDDVIAEISNREINGREKIKQAGSFYSFLVNVARELDEYYHSYPSRITISNSDYNSLNEWIKNMIYKVSATNRSRK